MASYRRPWSAPKYTAEQDHKAMMEALHLDSIRQGRNGMNPQDPNYANYDEAKANPFPVLPDPLKFNNGKPVKFGPRLAASKGRDRGVI